MSGNIRRHYESNARRLVALGRWKKTQPGLPLPTTEAALQKASAQYFALRLPKTFIAIHVSNEGRRGGRAGMLDGVRQKAAGLARGCPDWIIVGCHDNPVHTPHADVYMIELKAPGKYLSQAQAEFHARLKTCGVPVIVCRSLDEIEAVLMGWGILP